jgi:putative SOS response-associated peptidase YedK
MCFTIAIHATREEIETRFNAKFDDQAHFVPGYYFSAFTFPNIPVVTNRDPEIIRMYRWGLIPLWIKDESAADSIRTKTFNAKAETLTEKPSFRNAVRRNRCLVISKGFFEWQAREKEKIPYYIYMEDDQPFAFAGLYDQWVNPGTGEINQTFSIITTTANPLLAEIHNTKKRMPAILPGEREKQWIDPEVPLDAALQLLKPYDHSRMKAHTISKRISMPGTEKNVPETIDYFSYGNDVQNG